jgi:DNA repair photolyase
MPEHPFWVRIKGHGEKMMKVSVCNHRQILLPCGLKNFDFQVDPYVGCEHYCFYCYVLSQAETDWSKEILIHEDIVSQLSEEIDKISPQTIYMGYHTDPYQPCEAEYRQTRKVLELLLKKGFSASILTKSDLVVRDRDILKEMNCAAVSVSVAFNDNRTRGLFEAHTTATEKRIDALRQLKDAGIRTGALVCPVVPHITDAVQLIDMLEPNTDEIWIYGLNFSDRLGQNWLNVKKILSIQYPDWVEKIESAIFSTEHNYWTQLRENLAALKHDRQLNLNIHL